MEFIFRDYFSDIALREFWRRVEDANRGSEFFYDRAPLNGHEFCGWCRRPDNRVWLARHDGKFFAMSAINGVRGRTAYGHFLFLPDTYPLRLNGKPFLVEAARQQLLYWLRAKDTITGEPIYERVLGCTPENKKPAYKIIVKAGGRLVARMPGICFDWAEKKNLDGIITETKLEYLEH